MRLRILVLLSFVLPLAAQRQAGELRLSVTDRADRSLRASVAITSIVNDVRLSVATDQGGHYIARNLPLGPYEVRVESPGFAASLIAVDLQSAAPVSRVVVLDVAPVQTALTVGDSATLIDPNQTSTSHHVGRETIENRRASVPARGVLELVNRQPGWLLEANGVLHPRGSEYDTQYVINGFPITDNRSPAFAPAFEPEEVAAMRILTGGYPAEYGRKLGGVVELVTARDPRLGWHGKSVLQGGSFATRAGYADFSYSGRRTAMGFSAQGASTDRFLDPPVEANYTNHGASTGVTARVERDVSERDRLRFYGHTKRTGFLVPNEVVQQQVGQRQDRTGSETMLQAGYQRVLSPAWLVDVRAMGRDVEADLWSNPLATPINASQSRGFKEAYTGASVSASLGQHSLKFGGESIWTHVRERFAYRITDDDSFEDVPGEFRFAARRSGREHSAYIQDVIRAGAFTISAGLRWDQYHLLVSESFVSPRAGVAWRSDAAGLVLRASYDRAVTTPPIENLLLASSREARSLTPEVVGLEVRPARAHFYEAGFSKSLGRARIDGAWFQRRIRNYADDEVLLNTGVSFPIAFDRAFIRGFEAKLDVSRWGRFSGFASYSNLSGTGYGPVSGGLLLDDDDAVGPGASFPVSQDQRNTLQSRLRYDAHARVWVALGFAFHSGLPVEREGDLEDDEYWSDVAELRRRYGARVVDAVNFERGRIRPWYAIDLSSRVKLWSAERGSIALQGDLLNLTNRLNVINFAGLFSGTAIGAPRAAYLRLHAEF